MVFVLNRSKKPLNMITNAEARILLKKKLAVIHKIYPFTIRLRDNSCVSNDKSYTVKIDPGSRHTGIAIVDNKDSVVMLAELEHRGNVIKKNMSSRRAVRSFRRQRKTRYREARFLNRTKPEGWLAPSVKSRADNVINFIKKYKKFLNINKVMIENVSFDTAQMASDNYLVGTGYQQGPLYDTNLREFVFSKTNGRCSYCGAKATEIDHIIPRVKGGSNSTFNLTPACRSCNQKKSNKTLKEFGKLMNKDYSHLKPKKLPKDASIVQSSRNYMVKEITKLVSDTTTHDAWLTKYNRDQLVLPKEHYYDALSVGNIENYKFLIDKVLLISAQGRGSRQMCRVDKYGFPRTSAKASKTVKGFQTGDMVKVIVPKGSNKGEYFGKVAVRSNGKFDINDIKTKTKTIQSVGYKYCHIIQRCDGYLYNYKESDFLSAIHNRVSVAKEA